MKAAGLFLKFAFLIFILVLPTSGIVTAADENNPPKSADEHTYPTNMEDTTSITITEGVGFGEIVIGAPRCTMDFVKSKFGQPAEETEMRLDYISQCGLDFRFRNDRAPLMRICLNPEFKGKLSSGISMSSTADDVFRVYGKPVWRLIVADVGYSIRSRVLISSVDKSKIFYRPDGVQFWFEGNRLSQIEVMSKGVDDSPFTPQPTAAYKAGRPSELNIEFDHNHPRWGPTARMERLWDYVKRLWIYWSVALAAMVIVAFILKDKLRKLYYRWRPLPEGRLLLLSDPSGGKVSNVNIWYQARRLKKKRLLIGSGKKADIQLPHESVAPLHARISARRTEGGIITTYLEGIGNAHVAVNEARKPVMPLIKSVEVRIGEFVFRYEQPSEYRQVQVRYTSGRVIEGVPTSWDINSPGFTLIPSKAPTWLDAKFINFRKLKGVYFVRDWDEDVRKNLLKRGKQLYKHPASVHFTDGEVVPGYLIGEYERRSGRFYFFPEDQSGDTVYILVERGSVKSLERSEDAVRTG